MRDGERRHWLFRMEQQPAEWSVYLPLLIFPCTIQSRSSFWALAHPGGPGKRAVKRLCWCGGLCRIYLSLNNKVYALPIIGLHALPNGPRILQAHISRCSVYLHIM